MAELEARVQGIVAREPALRAVLVSTTGGVPVLCASRGADGAVTARAEDLQDGLSALFAIAAVQAEKMQVGLLQTVTAFYEGILLLHINAAPLILTLIGTPEANAGALLAIGRSLRDALRNDNLLSR